MSSYAENWIPYADSLQQDAVEEVPHLDMTVQRGSDQLIRVVWIQNGRRYGVCMASNISFRRQCRYNDPRSSRIYFYAGTNNGEKITIAVFISVGRLVTCTCWRSCNIHCGVYS